MIQGSKSIYKTFKNILITTVAKEKNDQDHEL